MATLLRYDEFWADISADISLVLRYTRLWLHYGLIGHMVICTIIAAIEGVFAQ